MLLSGPVVLQLVQRERNNDTGVEQPWPHALCLDLLSCVCVIRHSPEKKLFPICLSQTSFGP